MFDPDVKILNNSPIVFFEEIPGIGEIELKGYLTVISLNGSEVNGKASL